MSVARPRSRWRAAGRVMAVAASGCLTVCLFAPASVFFANVLDFSRTFAELWPLLAAAALASALAVAAVLMTLPAGRARDIGIAVICALGVLTWVQSNFLLWDYGVLAGQPIDWASHSRAGVIDAAVWTLTLAAAVFASRTVARLAPAVSATLILLQGVGLAIQSGRSPDFWYNHIAFDDSARFSFSRGTNVVIVLLDTFQSDVFQQLLDEDTGLPQRLQGFTYFRNATSGFPSTAPSITFILTGRQFDNSTPFLPFVKAAFRTASLPKALKAAGFDVYYDNPYYWPTVYADASISSHVVPRRSSSLDAVSVSLAAALLKLGAFRSLPQIGKRLLAGDAGTLPPLPVAAGRTSSDENSATAVTAFFNTAERQASATTTAPVFRYYHLWGLHPPLAYDDQLRPMSAEFTRDNAKRQAKGLITLIQSFCRTLAERGVYDRTVLVVLGDHGTSFVPRLVTGPSSAGTGAVGAQVPTRQPFGLPLVLMKPLGAAGPLQISDAPVSLGDVPRTVMDAVGLPNTFPGVSMLSPAPPLDRRRTVFYYDPGALRLKEPFFPDLTEFTVSGFSWLDGSWRRTGRVFSPGRIQTQVVPSYAWGTRVSFKVGGKSEQYTTGGWSVPEAELTWTTGHAAWLQFHVPQPATDIRLRADVLPYLPATATHQRVRVFAGDQKVADWSVTARGVYEATVPKSLVIEGTLDLRFDLPDATSPRSATGQVLDQRELGIAVYSMELAEAGSAAGTGRN